MITLVVFSKDRALQCDSLLRSVKDKCSGIDRVVVIAKASTSKHETAYWEMGNDERVPFHELRIELDKPLGRMIEELVFGSQHVAFAVDDQLFYRSSDFAFAAKTLDQERAFVWSWRLGFNPDATLSADTCDGSFWACSPLVGHPDYRYLFHTDGALYRTPDWTAMLNEYLPDWRTGQYIPNDLEAAVAARRSEWAPTIGHHLGPLDPTCITWQLNRVQSKYGSPASNVVDTSVDVLAEAYLAGKRVDNEKLYIDTSWTTRFNPVGVRPTHVWACAEASRFYAGLIR